MKKFNLEEVISLGKEDQAKLIYGAKSNVCIWTVYILFLAYYASILNKPHEILILISFTAWGIVEFIISVRNLATVNDCRIKYLEEMYRLLYERSNIDVVCSETVEMDIIDGDSKWN